MFPPGNKRFVGGRGEKRKKGRKGRKLRIMVVTRNGRWFSIECRTESQQWGGEVGIAWGDTATGYLPVGHKSTITDNRSGSFDKRRISKGERPLIFIGWKRISRLWIARWVELVPSSENFPEVSFHPDHGRYLENRCVECVYYLLGQMNFLESPTWAGILNFQGAVRSNIENPS